MESSKSTGEVEYNLDYYTMGHISKFVAPGAVRIESHTFPDELETAAFMNPDGSQVLILSNRTGEDKTAEIRTGELVFRYTVPGDGAATLLWQADNSCRNFKWLV